MLLLFSALHFTFVLSFTVSVSCGPDVALFLVLYTYSDSSVHMKNKKELLSIPN
jgi:hypothetical protein